MERFTRTESLIGKDALKKLASSRVALFGVGGVGSYTLEALARAGVGAIDIIDKDDVSVSNINRQIIALSSTVGKPKAEVAAERVLDINPECNVIIRKMFYLPETADEIDFNEYDYVIDAVDTVTAKLLIISKSNEAGVPVISCMGTGDKLDPTAFKIMDLFETKGDGLSKVMRHECRKRGINKLCVVCSDEKPVVTESTDEAEKGKRHTPASISFVPSAAGLIMASKVINDLIKEE